MKTTAKICLTALTLGLVVFAAEVSMAAATPAVFDSTFELERFDADEQSFWDKFRDSVMKDKPAPAETPKVVDRKPVDSPKEAEKPKEVERRAMSYVEVRLVGNSNG